MTTIYDVLRRPIITEKSNYQNDKLGQYVFEVSKDATKGMVKDAVELHYGVNVVKVNIINVPAKRTRKYPSRRLGIRRSGYKKAIVWLEIGETIPIFEGVR
jgi:large subunit ribosomal protein L23